MGSPSKEGFLTDEQREVLKIASEINAEVMSTSPRSPTSMIGDHHPVKTGTWRAPVARPVRRTHSGKLIRVKKGEFFVVLLVWLIDCCFAFGN